MRQIMEQMMPDKRDRNVYSGQDRYEHPSEDDMTRRDLGPRGIPGAPDPAKMTPQREKKTPKQVIPGHTE